MDKVTDLEIKLAYLEDFVAQLDMVVKENSTELKKSMEINKALKARVLELEDLMKEEKKNARPPHY